jgi:RNA polymerase sigma factor (TIGR02999 family)
MFGLSESGEVTALLSAWREGDADALERLISIVYADLRRIAGRLMRAEGPEHTLQATALVHEAYLRLIREQERTWQDRVHFLAVAAQVMRNLLVDYARSAGRVKRGGATIAIALDVAPELAAVKPAIMLALDDALRGLSKIDARSSRIVELRYFAGLTNEEVAEVLGVSSKTVARDWNAAKLWLRAEIRSRQQGRCP